MTVKYSLLTLVIAFVMTLDAYAFKLSSPEFTNNGMLSVKHAACKLSASQQQVVFGENTNPALKWDDAPAKTKSFVLIVTDPNVPLDRRNVNVAGKTISKAAPRQTVYHWIITNIPSDIHSIKAGVASAKSANENKPVIKLSNSCASIVSYTDKKAFAKSYVGPCPPSNDERTHHYIFNLYALNVSSVPQGLTKKQLIKFVKQHALKKARLVAIRSNNPN